MAESFFDLYSEEVEKNDKLKNKMSYLKNENTSLNNRVKYLETHMDTIVEKTVESAVAKVSTSYQEVIDKLNYKIENLESLLNINSDNSGIPTSKTAVSRTKRIPNTRTKSDKKIGGQAGHKKHKLEKFSDTEISEYIDHFPEQNSHSLAELKVFAVKDEYDLKVVLRKIRHRFYEGFDKKSGKVIRAGIPNNLKEENQYGNNIQALAITLVNEGCVSMSRTKDIIYGLTEQNILLSEGYIAKLQKRLATSLEGFMKEIKQEVIKLPLVHWDDTVISINKKQACLRFYGDKSTALYTAHEKKDRAGIDKDCILALLKKDTVVMHDHNIINYNDDFEFTNAECCAHLARDLQSVSDNLQHEWSDDMRKLILGAHKARRENHFFNVEQLWLDYDMYVSKGRMEYEKSRYYADKENALLNRLEKYKENYLMWSVNIEIPFTNNESERALRMSKTKMKVSGQFQNINSAQYYATIKSYIETGKRHGLNTQHLIIRALEGNYCTLDEMKNHEI